MKLTIDISDDLYDGIVKNEYGLYNGKFFDMIRGGTPLPKGHGRLIDVDALGEKLHRYTEAPYQYALMVFNESPIIIEADKE